MWVSLVRPLFFTVILQLYDGGQAADKNREWSQKLVTPGNPVESNKKSGTLGNSPGLQSTGIQDAIDGDSQTILSETSHKQWISPKLIDLKQVKGHNNDGTIHQNRRSPQTVEKRWANPSFSVEPNPSTSSYLAARKHQLNEAKSGDKHFKYSSQRAHGLHHSDTGLISHSGGHEINTQTTRIYSQHQPTVGLIDLQTISDARKRSEPGPLRQDAISKQSRPNLDGGLWHHQLQLGLAQTHRDDGIVQSHRDKTHPMPQVEGAREPFYGTSKGQVEITKLSSQSNHSKGRPLQPESGISNKDKIKDSQGGDLPLETFRSEVKPELYHDSEIPSKPIYHEVKSTPPQVKIGGLTKFQLGILSPDSEHERERWLQHDVRSQKANLGSGSLLHQPLSRSAELPASSGITQHQSNVGLSKPLKSRQPQLKKSSTNSCLELDSMEIVPEKELFQARAEEERLKPRIELESFRPERGSSQIIPETQSPKSQTQVQYLKPETDLEQISLQASPGTKSSSLQSEIKPPQHTELLTTPVEITPARSNLEIDSPQDLKLRLPEPNSPQSRPPQYSFGSSQSPVKQDRNHLISDSSNKRDVGTNSLDNREPDLDHSRIPLNSRIRQSNENLNENVNKFRSDYKEVSFRGVESNVGLEDKRGTEPSFVVPLRAESRDITPIGSLTSGDLIKKSESGKLESGGRSRTPFYAGRSTQPKEINLRSPVSEIGARVENGVINSKRNHIVIQPQYSAINHFQLWGRENATNRGSTLKGQAFGAKDKQPETSLRLPGEQSRVFFSDGHLTPKEGTSALSPPPKPTNKPHDLSIVSIPTNLPTETIRYENQTEKREHNLRSKKDEKNLLGFRPGAPNRERKSNSDENSLLRGPQPLREFTSLKSVHNDVAIPSQPKITPKTGNLNIHLKTNLKHEETTHHYGNQEKNSPEEQIKQEKPSLVDDVTSEKRIFVVPFLNETKVQENTHGQVNKHQSRSFSKPRIPSRVPRVLGINSTTSPGPSHKSFRQSGANGAKKDLNVHQSESERSLPSLDHTKDRDVGPFPSSFDLPLAYLVNDPFENSDERGIQPKIYPESAGTSELFHSAQQEISKFSNILNSEIVGGEFVQHKLGNGNLEDQIQRQIRSQGNLYLKPNSQLVLKGENKKQNNAPNLVLQKHTDTIKITNRPNKQRQNQSVKRPSNSLFPVQVKNKLKQKQKVQEQAKVENQRVNLSKFIQKTQQNQWNPSLQTNFQTIKSTPKFHFPSNSRIHTNEYRNRGSPLTVIPATKFRLPQIPGGGIRKTPPIYRQLKHPRIGQPHPNSEIVLKP